MPMSKNNEFNNFLSRLEKLSDEHRKEATSKRHQSGNRTARENLNHLIEEDSFIEFGAFAVAAQRSRKEYDALQTEYKAWTKRQEDAKQANVASQKKKAEDQAEKELKKRAEKREDDLLKHKMDIQRIAADKGVLPKEPLSVSPTAAITPTAPVGPVQHTGTGARPAVGGGDNDVIEAMRNEIAELKNRLYILQNGGVVENELIRKKVNEFESLLNMVGGEGSLDSAVTDLFNGLKEIILSNDDPETIESVVRSKIMASLSSDVRENMNDDVSEKITKLVRIIKQVYDINKLLENIRDKLNESMKSGTSIDDAVRDLETDYNAAWANTEYDRISN